MIVCDKYAQRFPKLYFLNDKHEHDEINVVV
jgi:hypothetical protein